MGFFTKLRNLITGKGWQETEQIQQDNKLFEETKKALEQAEDIQKENIIQEGKTNEQIKKEQEDITKKLEELKKETEEPIQTEQKITYKEKTPIGKLQEQMKTKEELNTIKFTPSSNLGETGNVYRELLKKSVISLKLQDGTIDNAMLDLIIQNRQKLRHRFSAVINITTEQGTGVLELDGVLAEEVKDIYKFINIGRTYTSNEMRTQMQEAMKYFNNTYGTIGGSLVLPGGGKTTVQSIDVQLTFA